MGIRIERGKFFDDAEVDGEAEALALELAPALDALERRRRTLRFRTLVGLALSVVLAAVFAMGLGSLFELEPLLLLALGAVFFFVHLLGWQLALGAPRQAYRDAYKLGVVAPLVTRRYPGATYDPQGGIDLVDVYESRLFPERIDRFVAEDLIVAQLGPTRVRFGDVWAQGREGRRLVLGNGSKAGEDEWGDVFRGPFLVADVPARFRGATIVRPDIAELFLGSFGRNLSRLAGSESDLQLVELDDARFERVFAVYSSDEAEARFFLDPDRLRRIYDLFVGLQSMLYLAFVGERAYVGMVAGRPLFRTPSTWRPIDARVVARAMAQVGLLQRIVDGLELRGPSASSA